MNPTRRKVLIGAAAAGVAAAMPGAAAAEYLEFAAHRWPMWDLRGMYSALACLKHADEQGLSPESPQIYNDDVRKALRYCVFAGWAVPTGNGRLHMSEIGRQEYEAEMLEWRS